LFLPWQDLPLKDGVILVYIGQLCFPSLRHLPLFPLPRGAQLSLGMPKSLSPA